MLFWVIAVTSLSMPYAQTILSPANQSALRSCFVVLVLIHFVLSLLSRLYLVPQAERMRRKQLLSDAFDTRLTHERTSLYYNNEYSPSVERLGASVMENAMFGKETAARMLARKRKIIGLYLTVWFLAFALRHNNLELITWITQLVFSGEIVAGWLKLECLRFRHERTYEQLHSHFLHGIGVDQPRGIANVLDAFAAYESAKASAGALLSTKIFNQLNDGLTSKWEQIRIDLKMHSQQDECTVPSETAPSAAPDVR
ncbi:MAG: hypothetical protein RBR35_11650 [Salinivirgaceae bacterium]|jgi:hypothetical protein|nr:hypothetical protein [Salinivirgaceae bacterium]